MFRCVKGCGQSRGSYACGHRVSVRGLDTGVDNQSCSEKSPVCSQVVNDRICQIHGPGQSKENGRTG